MVAGRSGRDRNDEPDPITTAVCSATRWPTTGTRGLQSSPRSPSNYGSDDHRDPDLSQHRHAAGCRPKCGIVLMQDTQHLVHRQLRLTLQIGNPDHHGQLYLDPAGDLPETLSQPQVYPQIAGRLIGRLPAVVAAIASDHPARCSRSTSTSIDDALRFVAPFIGRAPDHDRRAHVELGGYVGSNTERPGKVPDRTHASSSNAGSRRCRPISTAAGLRLSAALCRPTITGTGS